MDPHSWFLKTRVSLSHWQLRSMIVKSSGDAQGNSSGIYYAHNKSVRRVHLDTLDGEGGLLENQSVFSELHFDTLLTPAGLDECEGVVAVSGPPVESLNPSGRPQSLGYFAVYFPHTGKLERFDVGSHINNGVSVDKAPGMSSQFRTYTCNNNRRLYCADTRNAGLVMNKPLELPASLNHCKLSPDFQTLVAVGDCAEIYLVHPQEPTKVAEQIHTPSDYGFSTAFSKGGTHFTTCFQSGEAYVYDVRNTKKPLHTIHTTRHTPKGAFRNVRVADPLEDLIFISEHKGRIHIIDTRDFSKHMVMMLPGKLLDNNSYIQPVVKPYDVVTQEIARFGGDVEKSGHIYNGESYPQVDSGEGLLGAAGLNAMSFRLYSRRSQYAQHFQQLQDRFPRTLGPHIVRSAPSINIVHRGLWDSNYDDDILAATDAPGPPFLPAPGDYIDGSETDVWARETVGQAYSCDMVRSSRLFQYNRQDCPTLYSQGDVRYVLDLHQRQYHPLQALAPLTAANDPFFFVDSATDILGMEVLSRGGEKALAFASPEGIALWGINSWKRQCFRAYELC